MNRNNKWKLHKEMLINLFFDSAKFDQAIIEIKQEISRFKEKNKVKLATKRRY